MIKELRIKGLIYNLGVSDGEDGRQYLYINHLPIGYLRKENDNLVLRIYKSWIVSIPQIDFVEIEE